MLLYQKMFVVSAAVAGGLVVSAAGYAQSASQVPPPAAPAGAMGGLNLTQAQRDQIRTLREAQRQDSQALREKMRSARQQLRQAMRADVWDEATVRAAAGAVAALQADQAVLQARARGQFMNVLTPEQQARMKQARARAAQRAQRTTQRATRAQRPQWRMMLFNQRMYQDRLMRHQFYRWWRGWI